MMKETFQLRNTPKKDSIFFLCNTLVLFAFFLSWVSKLPFFP